MENTNINRADRLEKVTDNVLGLNGKINGILKQLHYEIDLFEEWYEICNKIFDFEEKIIKETRNSQNIN